MRIVFFGTSDFAATVLDALSHHGRAPVLVVTAPPRPKGRGRILEPSPVGRRASELGFPTIEPERVNAPESLASIQSAAPDLFVVVAYGHILRDALLAMPKLGAVNLHGSILPEYRGAAPIARALANGAIETGVTLQFMAKEVDAGDVIATARMAIEPDENAGELSARMSRVAGDLMIRWLPALEDGKAPREPQDSQRATFAPQLQKVEGRIVWTNSAESIRNHVRAMTPWPGAFTEIEGAATPERWVIRRARVENRSATASAPGTIVSIGATIDVATGSGILAVERLLRPGKRELSAEEFLRGARVQIGTVLR